MLVVYTYTENTTVHAHGCCLAAIRKDTKYDSADFYVLTVEYSTKDLVFELYEELPVFLFQEHSKIPQFSVKGANFGDCSKSLRIGKISRRFYLF